MSLRHDSSDGARLACLMNINYDIGTTIWPQSVSRCSVNVILKMMIYNYSYPDIRQYE